MHSISSVILHFLKVNSRSLLIYLFSFAAIALILAFHPNEYFTLWQITFRAEEAVQKVDYSAV
jgi:hypothetical protein